MVVGEAKTVGSTRQDLSTFGEVVRARPPRRATEDARFSSASDSLLSTTTKHPQRHSLNLHRDHLGGTSLFSSAFPSPPTHRALAFLPSVAHFRRRPNLLVCVYCCRSVGLAGLLFLNAELPGLVYSLSVPDLLSPPSALGSRASECEGWR